MKIQIEESALDSMKVMVQRLQEERDTLRAQLDALRGQEPVAWAHWEAIGIGDEPMRIVVKETEPNDHDKRIANWFKLYADPVAPAQLDALQSGDELPEPEFWLYPLGAGFRMHHGKEAPDGVELCDAYYTVGQLRQAQAMARAKLLAELGEVDCSSTGVCVRSGLYTRPLPAQTSSLPERDSSKPAEAQGLFHKFNVTRTDGSDGPGGKHYGCEYFVLDVDHDQHAKAALQAYAAACAQSHPQLSADLIARHGAHPAQDVNAELVEALEAIATGVIVPPMTSEQARQMYQWQDAATTALANAKAAQQKEITS